MNPLAWLRTSRNGDQRPAGHMTWAHTSVGRSITRTGVFLKRQIWIWPILAVVLLSILGFFVRRAIENTMRDNLVSQLQSLVDLETAMLGTGLVSRNRTPNRSQTMSMYANRFTRSSNPFNRPLPPASVARQLAPMVPQPLGILPLCALNSINRSAPRSRLIATLAMSSPTRKSELSLPAGPSSSVSRFPSTLNSSTAHSTATRSSRRRMPARSQ